MAKTWGEITADAEFGALTAAEQEQVREAFWERRVKPTVAEADMETARAYFDQRTRIRKQDPMGMEADGTRGPVIQSGVQGGRGESPGRGVPTLGERMQTAMRPAPAAPVAPPPPAEPAGLSPEWGGFDAAPEPKRSVLEQPMRQDVPFAEASRFQRQIDDAKANVPATTGTMRRATRDQTLAFDVNEALPDNAVARGAAAGFANLGRIGIGAARIAADFTGADDASRFLRGASGAASATEQGSLTGLEGNDKLVASITSSIMNSAPSLAVGMLGGPALRTLFAQSTMAEYNAGRDAGFDPGESLGRAGIMGAAEALGERFGFSEQIKLLKAATKGMPQNELAKVFGAIIAKEIPGEQLTTAMQFLADKIGPAALSPNATFADYLDAAAETLKVTIGQTAVMGGGPAAISTARNTYQRADQAAQAPESAAAAAIAQAGEAFSRFFKPAPEATAPTAARADSLKRFDEAAAAWGLNPKAAAAVREQAGAMPSDEVPGFLSRAVQAFNRRGFFARPVDEAGVTELDKRLRPPPEPEAKAPAPKPVESVPPTQAVPAADLITPEAPNDQPDVPGTAAEPVRAADAGGDLAPGGELAVGSGADQRDGVVRAPVGAGASDPAPGAVADGGGPDPALTIPPTARSPEQAMAAMERASAQDYANSKQRDRVEFEDREATDILSPKGTAWASKVSANKRLKELGPGHRLARVSTGWVVKPEAARLSAKTDTTGYNQLEQDAAAPASTPAAGVEPAAAPVAAAPEGKTWLTPAGNVMSAAGNPDPTAEYERGRAEAPRIAWEEEQGKRLGLESTSQGVGRRVGGLGDVIVSVVSEPGVLPLRAEVRADYMGKRFATRTAEGDAAIQAAVDEFAAKLQEGRERMAREKVAAERGMPDAEAAPALPLKYTPGQRVTVDGTAYTVAKVGKASVTLQGEDGKKRLIQTSAPAYAKIKAGPVNALPERVEPKAGGEQIAKPKVFKLRSQAEKAKAGNTERLRKVKGGYILRPATDKELAAADRAGKRLAAGGGVDVDRDPLLTAIAKLGGLALKERSDTIGEGNRNIGGKMLFRVSGKSIDDMAENVLQEFGYIPAEARRDAVRWLRDAIKDEFMGSRQHFSEQGTGWLEDATGNAVMTAEEIEAAQQAYDEAEAERLADWTADDLESSGYTEASPEVQALTEQLIAEAESLGIDTEALRERAATQTEGKAADEYHQAAQAAIRQAIAEARADAGRGDAAAARAGSEDRSEPAGDQGQEGLTSPTPESLRAADERRRDTERADAAEQKRLADRARADAERDEFTLTGSDRPADVAAAAGQGGLFDAPASSPAAEKTTPPTEASSPPATPERPTALIEARKRLAVLEALRRCIG